MAHGLWHAVYAPNHGCCGTNKQRLRLLCVSLVGTLNAPDFTNIPVFRGSKVHAGCGAGFPFDRGFLTRWREELFPWDAGTARIPAHCWTVPFRRVVRNLLYASWRWSAALLTCFPVSCFRCPFLPCVFADLLRIAHQKKNRAHGRFWFTLPSKSVFFAFAEARQAWHRRHVCHSNSAFSMYRWHRV